MSSSPKAAARPRSAGVLLPLFSLPGPFGIGDLGRAARVWGRGLAESGQRYWQILPVGPSAEGNSPYSPQSVFAGEPLLISPELLAEEGLLSEADLAAAPEFPRERVDYAAVSSFKDELFRSAFKAFKEKASAPAFSEWRAFATRHRGWLPDFALFRALKSERRGEPWSRWPEPLRRGQFRFWQGDLKALGEESSYQEFLQFLFDRQWRRLKDDLGALGLKVIGDIPFYPALESADVWSHPGYFSVDDGGRPVSYGGVPPDYFSADGQHWGTPVYRWEAMEADGYAWWHARLSRAAELYDAARLDHFIGFTRYWEIPASAKTAAGGSWKKGPGEKFFKIAGRDLGALEIVAENLGALTPEVEALRAKLHFPGMRMLPFELSERRARLPRLPWNTVVMSGNHDTPTLAEWLGVFSGRAALEKAFSKPEGVQRGLLREVYGSAARTALVPVQDLLGLGGEARVNRPAVREGNWSWRIPSDGLLARALDLAGSLTRESGRFEKIPSQGARS